jgi:hypothetical protein
MRNLGQRVLHRVFAKQALSGSHGCGDRRRWLGLRNSDQSRPRATPNAVLATSRARRRSRLAAMVAASGAGIMPSMPKRARRQNGAESALQ